MHFPKAANLQSLAKKAAPVPITSGKKRLVRERRLEGWRAGGGR